MYHEVWTGEVMIQFWDMKMDYIKEADTYPRLNGVLIPIEELHMDYCSIGCVTKSNN